MAQAVRGVEVYTGSTIRFVVSNRHGDHLIVLHLFLYHVVWKLTMACIHKIRWSLVMNLIVLQVWIDRRRYSKKRVYTSRASLSISVD